LFLISLGDDIGNERLKEQIEFILEIDKEKHILKQPHITGVVPSGKVKAGLKSYS